MKLPSTLKIGGKIFKVRVQRVENTDLLHDLGVCNHATCTIDILESGSNDSDRDTLWHEALHAMLKAGGLNREAESERLVGLLSHAIDALLIDNPTILEMYGKEKVK